MANRFDAARTWFEKARRRLERGDLAGARTAAEKGLAGIEAAKGPRANEARVEAWTLLAAVYSEAQEDATALEYVERVYEVAPGDAEAMLLEARIRVDQWELDRADELLERVVPPAEIEGVVVYHRAIAADVRGDFARADELYTEAARLDPTCAPPVRMDDEEALELLGGLIAAFPEDVRATLDNVQIDILDMPEPAVDRSPETSPLLLGVYHGVPQPDKSAMPWAPHDRVRLFKRNIERMAADREHLVEQLRITLLHEVGHHLGWDEDELEERGIG